MFITSRGKMFMDNVNLIYVISLDQETRLSSWFLIPACSRLQGLSHGREEIGEEKCCLRAIRSWKGRRYKVHLSHRSLVLESMWAIGSFLVFVFGCMLEAFLSTLIYLQPEVCVTAVPLDDSKATLELAPKVFMLHVI